MIEYLYRYEDILYAVLNDWEEVADSYVKIEERKYRVVKETPCGYWISFEDRKWISKTSKKRFAYPTKKEARDSFKARKTRQIEILTKQIDRAKTALNIISKEK